VVYSSNREESVLTLLSDLYLALEAISVSVIRLSSCLMSHYLLATIDYYSKEKVTDFGLRRLFYSKQGLKDICYSLA